MSLSRFPLPAVRKPRRAAGTSGRSSYSLRHAPQHWHCRQGLPYKFSSQKSLKKKKKQNTQFNPPKTSHIKSWQLRITRFLPKAQGRCQRPRQTQWPFTARYRTWAPGNGCALCHAEILGITPCCRFPPDPCRSSTAVSAPGSSGPRWGSHTLHPDRPNSHWWWCRDSWGQTQLTVVLGHQHSRFYNGVFHQLILDQGRVQKSGTLHIQQATHPGLELQSWAMESDWGGGWAV